MEAPARTLGVLAVDMMSQPCRALVLLDALSGGGLVERKTVLIHKAQHLSEEERARNPIGRLPYLELSDPAGERVLTESHAIARYLAAASGGRVPRHLYPTGDALACARVDALLDWQHTNLRQGAAKLVFAEVIGPRRGLAVPPAIVEQARSTLNAALRAMGETHLAGGRREWLGGLADASFADVSALCELDQLRTLGGAYEALVAGPHPVVAAWAERTRRRLEPHYSRATDMLRRVERRASSSASRL